MLYHLPDPAAGVAELARVLADDGTAIVATNGFAHMRELWSIRADVFGVADGDATISAFGADGGFADLRAHFGDIRWQAFADRLVCTDRADVVAYLSSSPPGDTASADGIANLSAIIDRAFAAEGGTLTVTKDVGCFVCSSPHRDRTQA